ncbi:MRE11 double-strand break endo/exonuclease [Mycobacterium phage Bobby]|nr:MRE11 double-strand break endo/exonuclease [Mycobacterium phage Bobby]
MSDGEKSLGDRLADRLAEYLAQPTAQEVESTEFDTNGNYIQTRVLESQPETVDEVMETFGHDPEKCYVDGPVSIAHRELADGRIVSTYRYKLRDRPAAVDIDEILKVVRKGKSHKPAGSASDRVFVFQASDLQLGKVDGYGPEGTVQRYFESVERAVAEYTKRHKENPIGAVHLIFAGDCIENGGVSQGGKLAWRQSLTVTEQVRVWRRMLMETVKRFAPLTDALFVSAVGGNHDDATRIPVQTRADDNWATEGAIAVADALEENPEAYGHVTVQVPPLDQGFMTVQVGETVFTILHGHQFRKGKAADWVASQAFYLGGPTKAHFICHGHWHSTSIHQDGPRTIVCSGTYDGGSSWYRDLTGAEARQGGLIYVTDGPEFEGLTRI